MGEASQSAGAFGASDRAALVVAIALHAALAALLVMQVNFRTDPPEVVPQGMTVNLASEVSLESTAPDPVAEARASTAPVEGEATPDIETPAEAEPRRDEAPTPSTRSTRAPRTRDTPRPRTSSSPTPRRTTPSNPGSNRFDEAFQNGPGTNTRSNETRIPASQIGASAKASIQAQMIRELRPHWRGKAPTGTDAEQLVTVVSFQLNPDGSLRGSPRVVRQSGVTPSNESQKGRHAEIALRAVRLAAPFDLPEEYYNAWKSVRALSFDRNLAR